MIVNLVLLISVYDLLQYCVSNFLNITSNDHHSLHKLILILSHRSLLLRLLLRYFLSRDYVRRKCCLMKGMKVSLIMILDVWRGCMCALTSVAKGVKSFANCPLMDVPVLGDICQETSYTAPLGPMTHLSSTPAMAWYQTSTPRREKRLSKEWIRSRRKCHVLHM